MKKRIWLIISVLLVVTVLFSACGTKAGSGSGTSSASASSAPSTDSASTTSTAPASGAPASGVPNNDDLVGDNLGKDYGLGPVGFDLDALVQRIGPDFVKGLKIGVSVNSTTTSWPKMWGEEFDALAKKYGFEVVILSADNDSVKEADNIATLQNQQVDGICISPIGPTIAQPLSQLYGKIPVVTCIPIKDAKVSVTINVDQEAKGAMIADQIAAEAGSQPVKVMTITNSNDIPQFTARITGFNNRIAEKYPNITVVKAIAENTDDGWLNLAKNTLLANPDINTIVAPYSAPMIAGYNAAEQLGRSDIKVYGCDANEASLGLLKDGKIAGIHVQFAQPQADECFFYLLRTIIGEKLPDVEWESKNYSMYYATPAKAENMLHMWFPDKYPAK
jgi:ribose transport system substrate-binding protein